MDGYVPLSCCRLQALCVSGSFTDMTLPRHAQDIELCEMALHRREEGTKLAGWTRILYFLNYVRRWTILPGLQATVPALIVTEGGDALSTCLNTVAILFLVRRSAIYFEPFSFASRNDSS